MHQFLYFSCTWQDYNKNNYYFRYIETYKDFFRSVRIAWILVWDHVHTCVFTAHVRTTRRKMTISDTWKHKKDVSENFRNSY